MPDNKSQNQNQGKKNQRVEREQQGNQREQQGGQRGNVGGDKEQGGGMGRQPQKGNRDIERDDVSQVGNDNDLDRDLDEDQEEITQRNPRVGEQGQRQGGMDRDRERE